MQTDKIVSVIFGAILIFYLIGATFNDASEEIENISETTKGGKLMKLLPLFFAFGVVLYMYKMFSGKSK